MEPRRNASDNAFSTTGRYPFGGLRHSPRGAPVWPRTFPTACLAVLRERLLAGKSVPARSLDLYLRGGCLRMPARGVLSSTQTGGLRSVQGSEGGVMVSKLSAPSPLLQWGVLDWLHHRPPGAREERVSALRSDAAERHPRPVRRVLAALTPVPGGDAAPARRRWAARRAAGAQIRPHDPAPRPPGDRGRGDVVPAAHRGALRGSSGSDHGDARRLSAGPGGVPRAAAPRHQQGGRATQAGDRRARRRRRPDQSCTPPGRAGPGRPDPRTRLPGAPQDAPLVVRCTLPVRILTNAC